MPGSSSSSLSALLCLSPFDSDTSTSHCPDLRGTINTRASLAIRPDHHNRLSASVRAAITGPGAERHRVRSFARIRLAALYYRADMTLIACRFRDVWEGRGEGRGAATAQVEAQDAPLAWIKANPPAGAKWAVYHYQAMGTGGSDPDGSGVASSPLFGPQSPAISLP